MFNNKICAVICEYNPFHYGHKYQLEQIKERYGTVIGVMSGNTVQRADCAVADKRLRAKTAFDCGMDLVTELPFPYSMLSARDFARAGVYIADKLGAEALAFGSECDGTGEKLTELASFLLSYDFLSELKEKIKSEKNISYPRLRVAVTAHRLGEDYATLLKSPNNILAIEYIMAIAELGLKLRPLPLPRCEKFLSSSEIRALSLKDTDGLLPPESENLLKFPFRTLLPLTNAIIAALRAAPYDSLDGLYNINGGYGNRIINAARTTDSLDKLIELCQTATYPRSRARRAVLSAFFGITQAQATALPEYTNLLAANPNGYRIAAAADIPVLTKRTDANALSYSARACFDYAERVDSVLSLCDTSGNNGSDDK